MAALHIKSCDNCRNKSFFIPVTLIFIKSIAPVIVYDLSLKKCSQSVRMHRKGEKTHYWLVRLTSLALNHKTQQLANPTGFFLLETATRLSCVECHSQIQEPTYGIKKKKTGTEFNCD